MNKCAKFHKDSPSDKKVKLNLPSAIELSETAVFVYNFVKKPYASQQLRWHIWPTYLLNFLYEIFTQDASLRLLYHGAKKSKMTKNSNQGGQDPLESILVIFGRRALIFFWKLLEKIKNDTTFVRMRSGDHLGDANMSKKGTSLRRIELF